MHGPPLTPFLPPLSPPHSVHHKFFAAAAVPVPTAAALGFFPVTAESTVRFRAPLHPGDRFVASAALAKVTRTRLFFADTILRLPGDGSPPEVAAEADVMIAWTGPDGRPTAMPPAWRDACMARAAEYAAAVEEAVGARPGLGM